MNCKTPQILLDGSYIACNCCSGCRQVKSNADRARKFYWARKRKNGGLNHA